MADQSQMPARRPHVAWRISRVVLHVLGKILLWAMVIVGTLALIAVIAGSIFMTEFSAYLRADVIPKAYEYADNLDLDSISLDQSSIIYYTDPSTGDYRELQQLYAAQNRIWVSYEDIPQALIDATIAIEDKRFEEHNGVDWLRTLSAVKNFVGGDASYGASTITQQLIKNLSLDNDVTIHRKVQEIFRALAVEERYTKQEILEWYLNTIYLGQGCYGVQSASEVYFAKDVQELSIAECACIIGITNNPSLYDPYIYPGNNAKRQATILSEMYSQGKITQAEYNQAKSQELVFRNGLYDERTYLCGTCSFEGPRSDYNELEDNAYFCPQCGAQNYEVDANNCYSYFVDTVYRDVVKDLSTTYDLSEQAAVQKLLTGGYRIYATINPEIQSQVDKVYEDLSNVPQYQSTQQLQSAIVIIDNETGDIIAMSGGVGKKEASLTLNRATQSKLPTGSSIKPIAVYAPALEAGVITPATAIEDSPFTENPDWPQNYYRKYGGNCLVLKGVANSLNTISVKTLDALGLQESYDFLTQKLGITTLVDSYSTGGKEYTDIAYAPLALGEQTWGLTVREMTQAFATFPNDGTFREARTYTQVLDAEGNVILDNSQESHTAVSEKTSFYVNYMLQYAVQYGTATAAQMSNMTVAGKTGTSNNNQCYWFAGYTPYYTAVTWCGYDDPETVTNSGNPALVMWNQVMKPLHSTLEYRKFSTLSGTNYYNICADCGKLAADSCKADLRTGSSRVTSVCLHYTDVPQDYCDCHILVKICAASGKIANEYCEQVEGNTVTERGMLIYNEDWKADYDEEWVFDPEDEECYCTLHTEDSLKPTEPPTESTDPSEDPTEPPEPTEPTDEIPQPTEPLEPTLPEWFSPALPPEETQWFERRKIEKTDR